MRRERVSSAAAGSAAASRSSSRKRMALPPFMASMALRYTPEVLRRSGSGICSNEPVSM